MATAEQIAEVRVATREYVNVEPFTNDYISSMIDQYGIIGAEQRIWIAKRNQAATLVDTSEGGSSRKNSQVFDQYSKIVAGYESAEGEEQQATARASRTREITRG